MLQSIRPHVYVVASTTPSHGELALLGIEESIPVCLIEKPPFSSIEELAQVRNALHATSQLFFNFNRRHMNITQKTRDLVESETFGQLRATSISGGNVGLAMNGSHIIDLHSYLVKSEVSDVSFMEDEVRKENPRGPQYFDFSGVGWLRFKDDSTLSIQLSGKVDSGFILVHVFDSGTVTYDESNGALEIRGVPVNGTSEGVATVERTTLHSEDAVAPTVRLLRQILVDGTGPDIRDAANVMRALVAAFCSGERGGVPLNVCDPELITRRFAWA
jgi:predicted dehydrogenase